MIELLTKPDPVAVKVKAAPPALTDNGEMLDSVGTGGGAVTVNVAPLDVPPPGIGFKTVIVRGC